MDCRLIAVAIFRSGKNEHGRPRDVNVLTRCEVTFPPSSGLTLDSRVPVAGIKEEDKIPVR
jgi:hypothetical protein